jgi:hypothetical protein
MNWRDVILLPLMFIYCICKCIVANTVTLLSKKLFYLALFKILTILKIFQIKVVDLNEVHILSHVQFSIW